MALPAHSPTNKTWKELDGYSEIYKKRTIEANEHMSKVIGAIKERDPDAIIVLIGDHGSWRYRDIWGKGDDPNQIMQAAGVDPTVVTLDVFGIMVAIYSNGRLRFLCLSDCYAGKSDAADIRLPVWRSVSHAAIGGRHIAPMAREEEALVDRARWQNAPALGALPAISQWLIGDRSHPIAAGI